jgi:hypothetical protein
MLMKCINLQIVGCDSRAYRTGRHRWSYIGRRTETAGKLQVHDGIRRSGDARSYCQLQLPNTRSSFNLYHMTDISSHMSRMDMMELTYLALFYGAGEHLNKLTPNNKSRTLQTYIFRYYCCDYSASASVDHLLI